MKHHSMIYCIAFVVLCLLLDASSGDFAPECNATDDCPRIEVCLNSVCSVCESTEQCHDHSVLLQCGVSAENAADAEKECIHKDLAPLHALDFVGILVMFVGGSVAAGGGLGGGGIFVPILILVVGYSARDAVPLSNAAVVGIGVGNVLQLALRRHPVANRPLIDYWLGMVMVPMMLAGTVFGVLLNTMFPNWLVLTLLVLVLGITVWRTFKKFQALWRKEALAHSDLQLPVNAAVEMRVNDVDDGMASTESTDESKTKQSDRGELSHRQRQSGALQTLLRSEAKTPWLVIVGEIICLAVVAVLSLLKGSSKGSSIVGVESCSEWFWVLQFAPAPILILVAIYVGRYLMGVHKKKVALGYQFMTGDVVWTLRNILLVSVASFIAGVISSLIGIGGGMVLGPLMLELAVLPEVTQAVSSVTVLFTGISSVIQYLVLKRMPPDYGVLFFGVGIIASWVGMKGLGYLVRRYNRKSLVIFAIGIIVLLSIILLVTVTALRIANDLRIGNTAAFSFRPPC